ncbi:MAG TPA: hypothetical protein VIJ20_14225, partial [Solirubrobacteraceae bacterium]
MSDDRREQPEPSKAAATRAVDGARKGPLFNVRRRIYLTYKYHGMWALVYRALTFPLRFTPLKRYLRIGPKARAEKAQALRWYRERGRPVTIVIPSYRDA